MKTHRTAAALACVLVAAATMMTGCQVAAVALSALPPPDIKAVYEPVDQTTLVLVDDPNHAVPSLHLLGVMAHQAGQTLRDEEVVSEVIPSNLLDELRLNERDFTSWPIDRIGKRLGAKQVVYVLIEQFQLTGPDQVYRPAVAMRVKVIDVATGKRLFPANDAAGHLLVARVPYKGPLEPAAPGSEQAMVRQLAQAAGADVAKLFFDHPPPDFAKNFDE